MATDHAGQDDANRKAPIREPLEAVVEALGRIRYGAIQLTVHDGRLVQVDVTERRRFP